MAKKLHSLVKLQRRHAFRERHVASSETIEKAMAETRQNEQVAKSPLSGKSEKRETKTHALWGARL